MVADSTAWNYFSGYAESLTCSGETDFIFMLPKSFGHVQDMARNSESLFTIITDLFFLCFSKGMKSA